jgi:hypothetical protein
LSRYGEDWKELKVLFNIGRHPIHAECSCDLRANLNDVLEPMGSTSGKNRASETKTVLIMAYGAA